MNTFLSPDRSFLTCPPHALLALALTVAACVPLRAQTSAVIHQFNFRVAEELTTGHSRNDHSRPVLSGFSVGTALPEAMVDSIVVDAERAFTRKLGYPVKVCWTKGKRGTGAGMFDMAGTLEGLPRNTFKLAKEHCPGETRFIDLDLSITDGGTMSIGEKSKMKPMVTMAYKVLDPEKNAVLENKVKLKDFGKLRTTTTWHGTVEKHDSETLSPQDIYGMYRQALAELMSE